MTKFNQTWKALPEVCVCPIHLDFMSQKDLPFKNIFISVSF